MIFRSKNKGVWFSFASIVPYSLIPLVFLINFNIGNSFSDSFVKGAVLTAGKDFFSSIFFVSLILYKQRGKETFSLLKTRSGMWTIIGAITGGPLGYTFYNTAFYMAGPSYGHVFTSLEPIFLGFFAYAFLKRRFKWQMWLGIVLTMSATIGLVIGEQFESNNAERILIGSALGVAGSIAWTIESITFDRAITLAGKDRLMPLLAIKMLAAAIFSFGLMFPITGAINAKPTISYQLFQSFFTIWDRFWRFIVVGILIVMGRFFFFSGLELQGATYTNVIYGLTVLFIPILNLIWYGISGNYIGPNSQLKAQFQIVFWIMIPLISSGATLVTIYKAKISREFEV